jgi:phosphoglycolate phosphatase
MTKKLNYEVGGIIFDFDGTLSELNIDFPALYQKIYELSKKFNADTTKLSQIYLIEVIEEIRELLSDSAGKEFFDAANRIVEKAEVLSAKRASLFDGTQRLLRNLREMGIKLGVVTRNCEEAAVTVYPEVREDVDVFLPREAVNRIKPHPEHLQTAADILSLRPENMAMVGDHPIDIISAIEVKMIPVGVLTGRSKRDELISSGAKLVLERATEITKYIDSDTKTLMVT